MILRLSLLFCALLFPGQSAWAESFIVVVHRTNPVDELQKKEIEDIFLKKVKFWRHGDIILPVDLPPNSSVRKEFSQEILQRPVSAVRNYWQYMIFSGREVQPPEFKSGDEVINYILRNPNAIGYIPISTNSSRVKPIIIRH